MNFETLQTIMAKYGIQITQMDVDVLLNIAHLPTSDIDKLFNEIAVTDVFSTNPNLF